MALRGAIVGTRLVIPGSGLGGFQDQIERRMVRNCEPAIPPGAVRNYEFQQVPTCVRRLLFEQVGRMAGQFQEPDARVQVRLVGALVVGQGDLDAVLVGTELGRAVIVVGRGDPPVELVDVHPVEAVLDLSVLSLEAGDGLLVETPLVLVALAEGGGNPFEDWRVELEAAQMLGELRHDHLLPGVGLRAPALVARAVVVDVLAPPELAALELADHRAAAVAAPDEAGEGELVAVKMNRPAEADTYWSAGDHFGDIAGDLKLRGIILQLQSWRWEDENPSLSLTLLNHAETLLGSRPEPASAALLLTRRALRYAETSHLDRTHAALAMQDVSNAQKYLSSIAPGDSLYIFEGVADEAITMRALSLLELNRPQEAAADLERIYTSIPSESLSWRAYIAADLAAVRVRLDDPEGASDMLGHALQMAAQAHALRVVQWVRTCRQRWLAGCDALPAVRRLDEQIHALPSPTVASLPG